MNSPLTKYSYLWITLILFLISFSGHWLLAWNAFVSEQQAHNKPIQFNEYLVEVGRDTLENWQSEFLQLMWQICGLSFLYFVGSPDSKEGNERQEEKLDLILTKIDAKNAHKELARLEKKYPKK
ncbi:MAG TPA: hypothetical protein PLS49_00350 [Candidatus Woesebacteria bacterium]|nr:hypothetical protein [Candidatus Woesebacteria bacterium]